MKKSIWPREIIPLWELVHVPPMEEENHLPHYLWRGYVSSLEGKSHKRLMTHSECTLKNNYKYNDLSCLHPKSPKLWGTLLISMGKPESPSKNGCLFKRTLASIKSIKAWFLSSRTAIPVHSTMLGASCSRGWTLERSGCCRGPQRV